MTTDPYISEADPDDIAEGWQAIAQTAPSILDNKSVLTATLRQMVHSGAFSSFDAKSMADLDKVLRQNRGQMPVVEQLS